MSAIGPRLFYADPYAYVLQIRMVLERRCRCFVTLRSGEEGVASEPAQLVHIPDPGVFKACVDELLELNDVAVCFLDSLGSTAVHTILAYTTKRMDEADREIRVAPASMTWDVDVRIYDWVVSDMDVPFEQFVRGDRISYLRSLDISRLNLTDEDMVVLATKSSFRSLEWLDLSGNREIGEKGVTTLARAISERRFPPLQWLGLLGTGYDAGPYREGMRWRISSAARRIAESLGYQDWMMLGGRLPELAGVEIVGEGCRERPDRRLF